MTTVGWMQIAVFFAADRRGDEAARRLHVPRLRGRAAAAPARARAASSACSTGCRGVDPQRGADLAAVRVRAARVQRLRPARHLRSSSALQHVLPFNPQHLGAVGARPRLQHGRQLHHQHQLAGVRGRVDDELPDPDGGARLAQLHLGRGRHRRRAGAGARSHAAARARRRRGRSATSGSTSSAGSSTCSCRSASSSRWCWCRRA